MSSESGFVEYTNEIPRSKRGKYDSKFKKKWKIDKSLKKSLTDCPFFPSGKCHRKPKCIYRHHIPQNFHFDMTCRNWDKPNFCKNFKCPFNHPKYFKPKHKSKGRVKVCTSASFKNSGLCKRKDCKFRHPKSFRKNQNFKNSYKSPTSPVRIKRTFKPPPTEPLPPLPSNTSKLPTIDSKLQSFLKNIKLEKYYENFVKNEFTFDTIKYIKDGDPELKLLFPHVSMGRMFVKEKDLFFGLSKKNVENLNEKKKEETLKYAFVLGNGKYEDKNLGELKFAQSDATGVSKMLSEKFNFEVYPRFEKKFNIDRDDMLDEFDYFLSIINEDKKKKENIGKSIFVIFYFAGHGIVVSNLDECFLPIDFKTSWLSIEVKTKKINNTNEMDVKEHEEFRKREIESRRRKILKSCLTKLHVQNHLALLGGQTLLLLDCCRSDQKIVFGNSRGMQKKQHVDGVCVSYSTLCGQRAWDKSYFSNNHSPYTYSLLKRLGNTKGKLNEILVGVSKDVKNDTSSNQTPIFETTTIIDWPVV